GRAGVLDEPRRGLVVGALRRLEVEHEVAPVVRGGARGTRCRLVAAAVRAAPAARQRSEADDDRDEHAGEAHVATLTICGGVSAPGRPGSARARSTTAPAAARAAWSARPCRS